MTYASKNLEADLKEIVLRQDFDGGELICQEATCMGDWVLLAALQRMEAGAFHELAGRPQALQINDYPWDISIVEAPETAATIRTESQKTTRISEASLLKIQKGLSFKYPHLSATQTPSKQTATDRKASLKELEASEHTREPAAVVRKWRRPSFITPEISGKEYGNVMHTIMQHISYEKCLDAANIQKELNRLVACGFLTPEQSELIDISKLQCFFSTEIGKKLCSGVPYLREFKFSILDSGKHYEPSLDNEHILLQGVVDCALLEEDGITVIDFKTDYVTENNLSQIIFRYRGQIQTYADALQRIYEQPVKDKYLYLFHLDRLVAL